MKLLENRVFSLFCALLIVFFSTVWNIDRDLEKRADAVENTWEEKYGIEEKLEERCSDAAQLWSVLRDYPALSGECDELRKSYNALYEMDMDAEHASALYLANEGLTKAAEALMNAAGEVSLRAEDKEWAGRYYGNMVNAQRVILSSDYPQTQAEFARLLQAPHVALLRPFLTTDIPEPFGNT